MKWIYLGKEEVFTCVSDSDYWKVSKFIWHSDSHGYACRKNKIKMHRVILDNIPFPLVIDHINRCKWDNCRMNLRTVTRKENSKNIGEPTPTNFPTKEEKEAAIKFRKKLKEAQLKHKLIPIHHMLKREIRNKTTGEVFCSIKEAATQYLVLPANITACCSGRRKICGGYEWEYLNERRLPKKTKASQ